jgi:hypothetical protein
MRSNFEKQYVGYPFAKFVVGKVVDETRVAGTRPDACLRMKRRRQKNIGRLFTAMCRQRG